MVGFDIDGTWYGEYTYDQSAALPEIPSAVRFTFMVSSGWFGRFHGTIQDDPQTGLPEAAVAGRCDGVDLTFTKRYPNQSPFVFHNGKLVKLSEYLQCEFGMPLDYEIPAMPVVYWGEYDRANEMLLGTWRFGDKKVSISSDGERYELDFPVTTGRWTASRTAG